MSNFSHLFLVLNSSANIIIYGWKDVKFREVLLNSFHLNWLMSTEEDSPYPHLVKLTKSDKKLIKKGLVKPKKKYRIV